MAQTTTPLYWGDNGAHEFWESEDHELLIFRNRGEKSWTAHRDYGFLFSAPSAEEAALRLNAILSPAQQWVRRKPGPFCLVPAKRTSKRTEAKCGLDLSREVADSLVSQRIWCNPAISIIHQRLAGRYVLRGEESGGAVRDIGAYCGYVDHEGNALPWIAPIETVASNGRHAVVLAQSFVRLHIVRVGHIFELLLTRHSLGSSPARKKPTIQSDILFRGSGLLSVDLCNTDNPLRGCLMPDFTSKNRKAQTIPREFARAVMVACGAVCCIGCSHAYFLRHFDLAGAQWPSAR